MNRTIFLIDGFNLYHSIERASVDLGGVSTKWLDLRALCASYLYVVGNNSQLVDVYYFSALAKHLEAMKPDVTKRHVTFIEALEATGVTVEMARFKKKFIHCPTCHANIKRYEEKETDVAIAVKLMELFVTAVCDTAVLMSGDTDVAPAVRTTQRLFPHKEVLFAFPYGRKNKELAKLVTRSFDISKEQYPRFQLADPFVLPNGKTLNKPVSW